MPTLWDGMRDALGQAIIEFNARVPGDTLQHSDCQAMGKYCARITKSSKAIEVFLNEPDNSLQTFQQPDRTETVCRFRLNKDRSSLELYVQEQDASRCVVERVIKPTEASERALAAFLFNPFPNDYSRII